MARVILYPAQVRKTAIDKAFPLVKVVLVDTLALSRRYVPRRKPRPYDPRPTGRLQRSLKRQGPITKVRTVSGRVGSEREYAMSVHDGARAHRFSARRKRLLSFWWEKHDVRFAGKSVNHPGVRAFAKKQYLWLPLTIVARRHNFRVRRLRGPLASGLSEI